VHHCTIPASLLLSPMDWTLERIMFVDRGLVGAWSKPEAGASLGDESFSDLDDSDDAC